MRDVSQSQSESASNRKLAKDGFCGEGITNIHTYFIHFHADQLLLKLEAVQTVAKNQPISQK